MNSDLIARPVSTAEALRILQARLSDHLSPAENNELDAAIAALAAQDTKAEPVAIAGVYEFKIGHFHPTGGVTTTKYTKQCKSSDEAYAYFLNLLKKHKVDERTYYLCRWGYVASIAPPTFAADQINAEAGIPYRAEVKFDNETRIVTGVIHASADQVNAEQTHVRRSDYDTLRAAAIRKMKVE